MGTKTDHAAMMAAASRAFSRDGYHATRVSDVVAEAGVSQGTFYQYFDSKDQAYLAIVEGMADELRRLVDFVDIESMDTVDDYRAQFVTVYGAAFELVVERPEEMALLLRGLHGQVNEAVADAARDLVDDLELLTAALVQRGIDRGFLRSLDVPTVSRGVVGLLLHTVERTLLGEGAAVDTGRLAATLVDFELHGAAATDVEEASPAGAEAGE